MKAENRKSCLQRNNVEGKGYVGAQSTSAQEQNKQDGATLMEEIQSRDNLNRAYKRVKRNYSVAGINGITVEEALPWLQEHR